MKTEAHPSRADRPRKPPQKIPQNYREIYLRRMEAGLTQVELADQAGVSQQHMSRVEGGKVGASPAVLKRIADVLGCQVIDLLREAA